MFRANAEMFSDTSSMWDTNCAREFLAIPQDQLLMMENIPEFSSKKEINCNITTTPKMTKTTECVTSKETTECVPSKETTECVPSKETTECVTSKETTSNQSKKSSKSLSHESSNSKENMVKENFPMKNKFKKALDKNDVVSRRSLSPTVFSTTSQSSSNLKRSSSLSDLNASVVNEAIKNQKMSFCNFLNSIQERFKTKDKSFTEEKIDEAVTGTEKPPEKNKENIGDNSHNDIQNQKVSIPTMPSPIKPNINTAVKEKYAKAKLASMHLVVMDEDNEEPNVQTLPKDNFVQDAQFPKCIMKKTSNVQSELRTSTIKSELNKMALLEKRLLTPEKCQTKSLDDILEEETEARVEKIKQILTKPKNNKTINNTSTNKKTTISIDSDGRKASTGNAEHIIEKETINHIDNKEHNEITPKTAGEAKCTTEEDMFGSQPIPSAQPFSLEGLNKVKPRVTNVTPNLGIKSFSQMALDFKSNESSPATNCSSHKKRKRSEKTHRKSRDSKSARVVDIQYTSDQIRSMIEIMKLLR